MLLAFGGICVALSIITLWASSVISINTFALLTLASAFVGIMHIEGGIKYSLLTYASVSVLSFLLPVDRLSFLYYLCLFGYFPVLKSYIERIRKLSFELIVKTLFYIVVSFLGVYVMSKFLGISLSEKLPWQIISVSGVVLLHIYDYALSIFFNFYIKRVRSKIRR